MTYSRRQLESFGEPLGDSVTRLKPGGKIYGGGSSSAPASSTVTNLSYPKELQPLVTDTVQKAAALAASPYQPYTYNRIAGFDPLQLTAQQYAANLTTSPNLASAANMAQQAAANMGAINYQPANIQTGAVMAPKIQQYQMGNAETIKPMSFEAPSMKAASAQYNPTLTAYQMDQAGSILEPGALQAYMSPYQQMVTDIQKREAARQSEIMRNQTQAMSVPMGAYGGSRQAIVEAERQRNLAQQLGDIQAQGSQSAFQNAIQQFNAEQQARMGVGAQNLAAKLGVQQLGAQTGLQMALANLTNAQQANVQNMAAILQTQGLNADQAMRAALANQQAEITTKQQNLQAALRAQEIASQQALEAQKANQQALLEAQRLSEQSRQYGATLGLQGLQGQISASGQLAGIGQTEFGQQKDIINAMSAAGQQRQALEQQKLAQNYQDFLEQKQYPYKQLGFISEALKGTPVTSTQTMYQAPGSLASQVAGLGVTGLAASKLFAKEGGLLKLALNKMAD